MIEFWIQQVSLNAPKDDSSCGDDGKFATSIQTDLQQQGSGDGDDQVDSGVSPPGAFPQTWLCVRTKTWSCACNISWSNLATSRSSTSRNRGKVQYKEF